MGQVVQEVLEVQAPLEVLGALVVQVLQVVLEAQEEQALREEQVQLVERVQQEEQALQEEQVQLVERVQQVAQVLLVVQEGQVHIEYMLWFYMETPWNIFRETFNYHIHVCYTFDTAVTVSITYCYIMIFFKSSFSSSREFDSHFMGKF